ncbi:MAG TPA: NAD-dependent epimerase/dehydratase family protein [Thermofilum sp.]|nr:NAD-dependent epimerase/dehydratase family protein [Thermofilum sp.]
MKWTRTNVLVTGGSGHIGSNVVKKLIERKAATIRVMDNLNAYPFNQLKVYGKEFQDADCVEMVRADIASKDIGEHFKDVDVVFHLAAYADVAATIYNPDEDFRTNVLGTYNVLKSSLDAGVKKYVFASSAAVYGNQPSSTPGEPPVFHEDMKPNPLSTYANSKLWGEYEANLFYKLYGLPTTSLRYFSVYGPMQIPKPKSHSWVIAIFLMRALKGKPMVVFGGNQVRDFTYIDDIAEATVKAAEASGNEGEAVNVGTGVPTRIDSLAETIKKIVKTKIGIESTIDYGPRPKGDPLGGYADTSKAKKLLNFTPQVSLEEGITKTLDWLLENKNLTPDYV